MKFCIYNFGRWKKEIKVVKFCYRYYLQWCLRLPSQNSIPQPMQWSTAWSGTQSVGAGANSSTASQDMSEGKDSPWSPALSTESGKEPYFEEK